MWNVDFLSDDDGDDDDDYDDENDGESPLVKKRTLLCAIRNFCFTLNIKGQCYANKGLILKMKWTKE